MSKAIVVEAALSQKSKELDHCPHSGPELTFPFPSTYELEFYGQLFQMVFPRFAYINKYD